MKLVINKRIIKEQMQYEIFALFINTVMIVDLLRLIVGNAGVIGIVRNGIYIITFVYVCSHAYFNKHLIVPIVIAVGYLILSVFSCLENMRLFETIMAGSMIFLFRCVVGFYLAYYIPINDLFYKKLKKYYIILFLYCFTYIMTSTHGVYTTDGSYMTFSYNILIMTSILLLESIQRLTLLKMLGAIALVGIVVSYGARGPMLCIAISMLLFLWYKFMASSVWKKIVIFSLCIGGTSGLFMLRNVIINILLKLNPSSRTLYLLRNFDLNNLSGRNTFYNLLISEINKNWILPHGLYADRLILGGSVVSDGELSQYYAHNFPLEIMVQFGAILGILLLLYLLFRALRCYRTLIKYKDPYYMLAFCAFFTGITTLFFSSSYLINERTWLAFGIMFSLSKISVRKNI